jgi:hypothetical protein
MHFYFTTARTYVRTRTGLKGQRYLNFKNVQCLEGRYYAIGILIIISVDNVYGDWKFQSHQSVVR